MQALLRVPRLSHDLRRRPALPGAQPVADEWMMPVVPRRLDQDAPDMSVAGFSLTKKPVAMTARFMEDRCARIPLRPGAAAPPVGRIHRRKRLPPSAGTALH